jgi:protoporphyrinogen oxidase
MKNNIIIGAGISGLALAHFLKKPHTVLEASGSAGGLCRSFNINGFTFDCSGHFIHIRDNTILKFLKRLTPLKKINRKAGIYFDSKIIPYPFQGNLKYLSAQIQKECFDGLKKAQQPAKPDAAFDKWALSAFGKGVCKHFMFPYNRKLWQMPLGKMTAAWCGHFVPSAKSKGYNAVFYYPSSGGVGAVIKPLAKNVVYNTPVTKIDIKNRTVNGFKYNNLFASQPLNELLRQITPLPKNVKRAAKNLKAASVRVINLGIKGNAPHNWHWVYYADKKIPFYRVGFYSNISKTAAPKGCYSLYVETNTKTSAAKVIEALKKLKIINGKIVAEQIIDIPCAYVNFLPCQKQNLKTINAFLSKHNIYPIGRYGKWEYSFIEKNILDAKSLAKEINRA